MNRSSFALVLTTAIGAMLFLTGRDKCKYNLTGIPAAYQRQSNKDFDGGEMKRIFALGEQMGRAGTCWVHTPWDELKLPSNTTQP